MRPAARLTAFAVGLVAFFGAGWLIGEAVGPFDEPSPVHHEEAVP